MSRIVLKSLPCTGPSHDAIEAYCLLDVQLTAQVYEAIGPGRFSFWSPPAYIQQHSERVRVDPDGYQHHYK